MTIGDCIKVLRDSAGLKQRELAELVGVSAPLLSLVEANKRDPTIQLLRDISRALDIPSAVLFAVALAKTGKAESAEMKRMREATDHLLFATQHSLAARRLSRLREKRPA